MAGASNNRPGKGEAPTSVFFSYSRKDRERALPLIRAIEDAGYPVWWDGMLEGGSKFLKTTEQALESAKAVVVLWTTHSVESDWVRDEATSGRERGRMIPLSLDGAMSPLGFRQVQLIDMRNWQANPDALDDLLRALAKLHDRDYDPPDRRQSEPGLAPSAKPSRRTAILAGLGLGTAGALGVLGTTLLRGRPGVSDTSLAVLPFTNEVPNGAQFDYLAQGLSSAVRDGLARNAAMKVVARASSEAVAAEGLAPAEIAKRLGVATLLEGRLQAGLGGGIELTTTLTDGQNGFMRWNQTQAYVAEKALELKDAVIRTVSSELSVGDRTQLQGSASVPEAFDEFMRGETALDRYASLEATQQARRHFETAISLDPTYADPRAALAELYLVLGSQQTDPGAARATLDKAKASADSAVAIAPNDPQVHVVQGLVRMVADLDFKTAAEPFERAKSLGLNTAKGLQRYAIFLTSAGRPDEAILAVRRAQSLDPLDASLFEVLGLSHYAARRYPAAIEAYRQALGFNPDRYLTRARLGTALILDGQVAEGLRECALEQNGIERLTCTSLGQLRQAQPEAARATLAELRENFGDATSYQQAQILTQMGETEAAMERLRLAEDKRDTGLTLAKLDPMLDPIREREDFKGLLVRLGFEG